MLVRDRSPKMFCANCQQRAWQPITLSGKGTLVSYTVIRVAATAHVDETPYAVSKVQVENTGQYRDLTI